MSETGAGQPTALAELRAKIDALDEAMHSLLMQRGEVIDSLIRIKGTSLPGAAFRPGREADMMRRMVARHHGGLPLVTVEHIWREIVSTFTHLQARFDLCLDGGAPRDRIQDLARFYFGFAVDLSVAPDAAAVVARVAGNGTDLGLVAIDQKPGTGLWWRGLGAGGPQIMGLLPFIRAAGRLADLPAFIVSPPLSDPSPGEIAVFAVVIERGDIRGASFEAVHVLAEASEAGRREALLAASSEKELTGFAAAAGLSLGAVRRVGTIARGIAVDGKGDLLYRQTPVGRLA